MQNKEEELEKEQKKILKEFENKKEPFLKILESLKKENEQALQKKKEELQNKKKALKEQYMKNLVENSKNPPMDYPEKLVLYYKHKGWDAIIKMLNAKKQDIKGHENFLRRELGKHNKTLDWFLAEFGEEIDNVNNE